MMSREMIGYDGKPEHAILILILILTVILNSVLI